MDWSPGLQALPLREVLFPRTTAAAGRTNGGHWAGLLLGCPVTGPFGHTAPTCAVASTLGWALWLPGTFFSCGWDTAAVMWEEREAEGT